MTASTKQGSDVVVEDDQTEEATWKLVHPLVPAAPMPPGVTPMVHGFGGR